jgi:hypothetical protein
VPASPALPTSYYQWWHGNGDDLAIADHYGQGVLRMLTTGTVDPSKWALYFEVVKLYEELNNPNATPLSPLSFFTRDALIKLANDSLNSGDLDTWSWAEGASVSDLGMNDAGLSGTALFSGLGLAAAGGIRYVGEGSELNKYINGNGIAPSGEETDIRDVSEEYVDLAAQDRRIHILEGDSATGGGGHAAYATIPGKTQFPAGWSDDKIMNAVSDIATDPEAWRNLTVGPNGNYQLVGTRDGLPIMVILNPTQGFSIWTAYPITGE